MAETFHPQPDNATRQWIRRSYSVRPGGYRHWRMLLLPTREDSDEIFSNTHDAWRSARPEASEYQVPFKELSQEAQVLCLMTGLDIQESIYQYLHIEPETVPRDFGPGFVYFAMQHVYTTYYPFVKTLAAVKERSESYAFLDTHATVFGPDSMYGRYGELPAEVKEVDRRMVMAGMVELEQLGTKLCDSDRQAEVLRLDTVQHAIADGHAILRAAQVAEPYDQSAAFASEVIHWNV